MNGPGRVLWLVLLLWAASGAHARSPESAAARVDRLFTRWSHRNTPGCTVGVIRDGKLILQRGYGMASLEFAVPNRSGTLFHLASVSKQFTAFAVQLLVQDGKLSLDDDVRRYIPELPDFGVRITVRHLIYHTSGLRDQPHLLWLGGWRFEDAITEDDVLRLISQQKELNFAPGQEDLYSNTGYTLLAVLVRRLSGKSLGEFAQERIFRPLGMTHTVIPGHYGAILRDRASSYEPDAVGGYRAVALSDSTVGATGVVTNLEDMARWDRNFDDARVGGKAVQAAMLTRGRLENGQRTSRGAGIRIEEYRGLPIIKHSGSIAGYRTRYIRFPDQRLAVVVLANTSDMDAEEMAYRVADIFLDGTLPPAVPDATPAPQPPPAEVAVDPRVLERYVGDYAFKPGEVVTIGREGDRLTAQATGQGKVTLYALSPTTFRMHNGDARLTFVTPETLTSRFGNEERTARRIATPLLTDYVGTYYSDELRVLYTVTLRQGTLYLQHPRGEAAMVRTLPDSFVLPSPLDHVRFTRGPSGACTGFTIDDGRVRNLRFVRAEIRRVTE